MANPLSHVMGLLRGGDSGSAHEELRNETLLMTLARASSADTFVHPVEVSTVQAVVKEVTGLEVTSADVQVAARSELFEEMPLVNALAGLRDSLSSDDRALIAQSLARVMKSDLRISSMETEFFDEVTRALKISPSELAGLVPAD